MCSITATLVGAALGLPQPSRADGQAVAHSPAYLVQPLPPRRPRWPSRPPSPPACSIEEAVGDDMQPIRRPVIRLPDEDTLLTRIEPGNPHSSMVFKLRCARRC